MFFGRRKNKGRGEGYNYLFIFYENVKRQLCHSFISKWSLSISNEENPFPTRM